MCVCDKIDWMENGWMDWIEWMWKVDSGAVPDLTIVTLAIVIVLINRTTGGEPTAKLFLAIFHPWTGTILCPSI